LTTIAVALCAALGMAVPSLAAAGSVAGTVSAAGGGGISGVQVCFRPQPEAFETICATTGPGGAYKADGLPGATYVVRFDAEPANLVYVSEYYDDAVSYFDLDHFTLGFGQDFQGLNAELAVGGAIGGTLTEDGTGLPVAGVRACAIDSQGIPLRCAGSGPTGAYQLNGLPSGTYNVEYEGGNRVNYLREFYEDADEWAAATDLTVTAPATTGSIDAKLAPGAQILGRVTEMGTGLAREDIFVCAYEVAPGERQDCDWTDVAGNYAIRSIPAGTYLVAFQPERYPSGLFADQWWQGVATMAEATPIPLVPPDTRTGIDGQVRPLFRPTPRPIQVTFVPRPKPKPKKCKKGFHKKKVKGKKRCVRKHKRHVQKAGKGARNSR
jgi:hypothetical protein